MADRIRYHKVIVTGNPTGKFLRDDFTWADVSGTTKVGVKNYDTATADGDVVITGVGFKPTSVLIVAHVASTMQFSIGQGDASLNLCAIDFGSVSAGTWNYSATKIITLMQTGAIYCEGSLKSLDVDGFTLAFVKTGAKTGTARIYYTAFR